MTEDAGAAWWQPATAVRRGRTERTATWTAESAVPFAAFLVFAVLLFLAPQAVVPGFGRVRLALLAGVFAIATHCWIRFATRRPVMRFTREVWLAAALLGWALITLPLSQWPPTSMRIFFGEYLKTSAVFWLLANTVSTRGRLRAVAWALSLTAAPMAATGLWNFLSHNVVRGRITGYDAPLTADPNGLAMVLNLMLPLTIALLLISRGRVVRGLLVGLIVLEAGAILVTFSRGGFLVLATTFVLYLRMLQKWGRLGWAIAALVLAVSAIPLLPTGYLHRLGTIRNIQDDETGSAQERWELTQIGLRHVAGHPLIGAGPGMSVVADCARRGWSGLQSENCARRCVEIAPPAILSPCLLVHNAYLQYGIEQGWLGLVLFLLLLASCIRGTGRIRERCAGVPAQTELALLAEAARITIVAFAVAALFYPWAYSVYLWYAAGLAVAVGAAYEAEAPSATVNWAPAHA